MKERPIIFSTTMIQAILAGNKTMTRRVVKKNEAGRVQLKGRNWHIDDPNATLACPYGQPGDMLWVRETWADVNTPDGPAILYRASGDYQHWHDFSETFGPDYGAGPSMDYEAYPALYTMWWEDLLAGEPGHGWKPSIHMPKWAARIWLKVVGVRVERLQDISEREAIAEGIENPWRDNSPRTDFAILWDSINVDRGYDWSKDPWVWVVEFERFNRTKE